MAEQHPIEGLMTTAMESIKEMVDVNTIVGDAVQSPDGTVIIPISKVAFGFAAGGGEYSGITNDDEDERSGSDSEDENGIKNGKYPFAGGSGAGVSINPVAFMVVGNGQIKLLPVNINSTLDRVLDLVPEIMCKLEDVFKKKVTIKKEVRTEGGDQIKRESETE
ncbi:MAG: GerW family sporulation protein [Clostridiaceae bacterium]